MRKCLPYFGRSSVGIQLAGSTSLLVLLFGVLGGAAQAQDSAEKCFNVSFREMKSLQIDFDGKGVLTRLFGELPKRWYPHGNEETEPFDADDFDLKLWPDLGKELSLIVTESTSEKSVTLPKPDADAPGGQKGGAKSDGGKAGEKPEQGDLGILVFEDKNSGKFFWVFQDVITPEDLGLSEPEPVKEVISIGNPPEKTEVLKKPGNWNEYLDARFTIELKGPDEQGEEAPQEPDQENETVVLAVENVFLADHWVVAGGQNVGGISRAAALSVSGVDLQTMEGLKPIHRRKPTFGKNDVSWSWENYEFGDSGAPLLGHELIRQLRRVRDEQLQQPPRHDVVLVYDQGATGIAEWKPSESMVSNSEALENANSFFDRNPYDTDFSFFSPSIRGLIWWQGEYDAEFFAGDAGKNSAQSNNAPQGEDGKRETYKAGLNAFLKAFAGGGWRLQGAEDTLPDELESGKELSRARRAERLKKFVVQIPSVDRRPETFLPLFDGQTHVTKGRVYLRSDWSSVRQAQFEVAGDYAKKDSLYDNLSLVSTLNGMGESFRVPNLPTAWIWSSHLDGDEGYEMLAGELASQIVDPESDSSSANVELNEISNTEFEIIFKGVHSESETLPLYVETSDVTNKSTLIQGALKDAADAKSVTITLSDPSSRLISVASIPEDAPRVDLFLKRKMGEEQGKEEKFSYWPMPAFRIQLKPPD